MKYQRDVKMVWGSWWGAKDEGYETYNSKNRVNSLRSAKPDYTTSHSCVSFFPQCYVCLAAQGYLPCAPENIRIRHGARY